MIISKLSGGLGNQMFQYAAGQSLALKHHTECFLDVMEFERFTFVKKKRKYQLDQFGINKIIKPKFQFFQQFQSNYRINNTIPIQEDQFNFNEGFFETPDNSHLIGYWQSERYFIDYKNEIIKAFTFPEIRDNKEQTIDYQDKIINSNSVSLHIRRGDYISEPRAKELHGSLSIEYYKKAISYVSKNITNPTFFIFSDDIPWVKNNLEIKHPHFFVEGNKSLDDMQLMSLCQHNIIANSSFSWWGAWLNQNTSKTVISPAQWFLAGNKDESDIRPVDWIKL